MRATIDSKPFSYLPTSEEFFLFPEDNSGTVPIDPTNQQHLRSMSPFVLTLDAPFMGNYVKNTEDVRPFRGARYSSPGMANTRSYEDLKVSPRLPTFSKSPIRNTRVSGLEAREDAGLVDRDQLISIATQDRQIRATPPIVFLINPTSMAFSYESVQNFSESTRYGFVFYRWGEQLSKIQISCRIGSFIAGRSSVEAPNKGNISGVSGLQFASRRDSAGWRQLMNILAVYRNSAAIRDVLGRSRANHAVGTQSIYFDGQRWTGRITNLSFAVSEGDQLGGIEFSMEFEVYKHTQEGFEMKSYLAPMFEPSPNLFGNRSKQKEQEVVAQEDTREDYDFSNET